MSYNYYHCTKVQRKPSSPIYTGAPRVISRSDQPLTVKAMRQRDHAENGYRKTTTSLGFTNPDNGYTSTNKMTYLTPEYDSSRYASRRHLSPHSSQMKSPVSIKTSWNPTESYVQLGSDKPNLNSSTSDYRGYEPSVYQTRFVDQVQNRNFGKRTNVFLGDGTRSPDGKTPSYYKTQLQQNTEWVQKDLAKTQELLREDKHVANQHKAVNLTSSFEIVGPEKAGAIQSTAQQLFANPWKKLPTSPKKDSPDFRRVNPFKSGEARDVKTILSEAEPSNKYRLASNAQASYTGFVFA